MSHSSCMPHVRVVSFFLLCQAHVAASFVDDDDDDDVQMAQPQIQQQQAGGANHMMS